jgi:hypothetical protein
MIFLPSAPALRVPPFGKTLPGPVVVVTSPLQCAIGVVALPDSVHLAVVVVTSPLQCAIGPVVLPEPVESAFCIKSCNFTSHFFFNKILHKKLY